MPVTIRWKLAFLLLLLSWGWASGQQPAASSKEPESLSGVARRTRQQRSDTKNPVRFITNADLLSLNSNVSTGSTSQDSPATEDVHKIEADKEAETFAFTGEELTEMRGQFEEARRNLMTVTNEAAVLQLRMNHLRNAFFTRSDGATQERIRYQLVETQQQIEENKLAQAAARSIIRELQREAQKAGLPKRQIQELTGRLPDEPLEIATPESGG